VLVRGTYGRGKVFYMLSGIDKVAQRRSLYAIGYNLRITVGMI